MIKTPKFLSKLIMTPLGDGKDFVLDNFLAFLTSQWGLIVAKKGFVSDGASIPWIVRPWLPVWGPWGKPAVIHDYCYRKTHLSRKICDKIILEGMKVKKVQPVKMLAIYAALRLFGWWAFYKDRRKQGGC